MGRKGSAMLRSNFDEKPLPRGRNDRIVGVDCLDRISSPAHWEPSGFANWEWLGSPEKGHHKIHTGSLITKVQWGGHPGSGSVPRFCTMLRQRDPPMGSRLFVYEMLSPKGSANERSLVQFKLALLNCTPSPVYGILISYTKFRCHFREEE